MKKNFLSLLLGLSFTAMTAQAAARWVPHKCGFDVPRLHRDQRWGLYEAFGASRKEAKQRAFRACKGELEASHPGACAKFAKEDTRWACNWTPRWEF